MVIGYIKIEPFCPYIDVRGGYMNRFLIVWLSGFGILLAQVDTAWVRRYNGTGNGQDCAKSIVVDNAGNVYVTGYSV